jgi:hypothetical protein
VAYSSILKLEAVYPSETSINVYQTIRLQLSDDNTLHVLNFIVTVILVCYSLSQRFEHATFSKNSSAVYILRYFSLSWWRYMNIHLVPPVLYTWSEIIFTCTPVFRSQHVRLKNCTKYKWHKIEGSRNSVVGIATGYGLDDGGGRSSSPGRVKNFLFSTSSRPALGSTQPPIQWVPVGLSAGREADHL